METLSLREALRGQGVTHLLDFSPDNSLMAYQDEGKLRLYDIREQRETHHWDRERGSNIAAFSPNGRLFAFVDDAEDNIVLWDTVANTEFRRLNQPNTSRFAFSPDGTQLVVGNTIGLVQSWDILSENPTSKLIYRPDGSGLPITNITFTETGTTLVFLEIPFNLHIWDLEINKQMFALESRGNSSLLERPSGTVFHYTNNEVATLINVLTGEEYASTRAPILDISPDEATFVTREGNVLWLRDVRGGEALIEIGSYEDATTFWLQFSSNSTHIAVETGGIVYLWGIPQ